MCLCLLKKNVELNYHYVLGCGRKVSFRVWSSWAQKHPDILMVLKYSLASQKMAGSVIVSALLCVGKVSFCLCSLSGGSEGAPPMAQNFLNFRQFFEKFGKNRILAPLVGLAPCPIGNPEYTPELR